MNNWFKLKFKAHVDSIVYENGLLTKKNSKPRQLTKRPCDYYELAEVMCKVGGYDKEIDLLIKQLEANAETEERGYFPDIGKQMAQLFYKIKNKEKSLHWFARVLQFQIEQCHISHATGTMKEAEELYGVDCLPELKLVILEKKGSFKQASKLATKF